jgi:hypothetical protein
MRKVDLQGTVAFLNESWLVGKRWRGEYIRATLDTARQQMSFWHKPDEDTDWRCLKTRLFRIHETVHDVVPALRRKSDDVVIACPARLCAKKSERCSAY